MKNVDTYKLWLVGYLLLGFISLTQVGFRPTKETCMAREYSGGKWGMVTSALVAAGLPIQIGLNLAVDGFDLGRVGVFRAKRYFDKDTYGNETEQHQDDRYIFNYNTPYCLKQSLYDITGVTFTRVAISELKASIRNALEAFPPERITHWTTAEEGFNLVKKLIAEEKALEYTQEEYAQVKGRLAAFLYGSDRLIASVFPKDDLLSGLAEQQTPLADLEMDSTYIIRGYPLERLVEEVADKLSDGIQVIQRRFDNLLDAEEYRKLLDLLKSCLHLQTKIALHCAKKSSSFSDGIAAFRQEVDREVVRITAPFDKTFTANDVFQQVLLTLMGRENDQFHQIVKSKNYANLKYNATILPQTSTSSRDLSKPMFPWLMDHSSLALFRHGIEKFIDPKNAITEGVDLEEPWLMPGSQGSLAVNFAQPIKPVLFALFVPLPDQDPFTLSHPHEVEVYSVDSDNEVLLARHFCKFQTNVEFIQPTTPITASYDKVRLQVVSNYGNKAFTSIYQFAAYGFLNDSIQ